MRQSEENHAWKTGEPRAEAGAVRDRFEGDRTRSSISMNQNARTAFRPSTVAEVVGPIFEGKAQIRPKPQGPREPTNGKENSRPELRGGTEE